MHRTQFSEGVANLSCPGNPTAIVAIGALDKIYMTSRAENDVNPGLSEDTDSPSSRRRIALDQYEKATRSM